MATDGQEVDSEIRNQDGALEASYIYVKVLGRGAFGEANLYRKTEVYCMHCLMNSYHS